MTMIGSFSSPSFLFLVFFVIACASPTSAEHSMTGSQQVTITHSISLDNGTYLNNTTLAVFAFQHENYSGNCYFADHITIANGTINDTWHNIYTIPENFSFAQLLLVPYCKVNNTTLSTTVDILITGNTSYSVNITFPVYAYSNHSTNASANYSYEFTNLISYLTQFVGIGVCILAVLMLFWGFKQILAPLR